MFGMLERRSGAETVFYGDDSRTGRLDEELMSRPRLTSSQQAQHVLFPLAPSLNQENWGL